MSHKWGSVYLFLLFMLIFLGMTTGLLGSVCVFQFLVIVMQELSLFASIFFCHNCFAAAAGGFLQTQHICVSYRMPNLAVSFVMLLSAVPGVYF
jgi:hypothetical protein